NGIGMARAFEAAFQGDIGAAQGVRPGFFAWVDGAPAAGYRARRAEPSPAATGRSPVCIVTGEYGAAVLEPLLQPLLAAGTASGAPLRLLPVKNDYFGGTIAVTGLLTGVDVAAALASQPEGHRYLLPDVCLSEGRFLDGTTLAELPRAVEVVGSDGLSLRRALDAESPEPTRHEQPVAISIGRR
ncbi:MAG: DUF512 domain-containing protein, partial [Acidimicrobiales bacterium]